MQRSAGLQQQRLADEIRRVLGAQLAHALRHGRLAQVHAAAQFGQGELELSALNSPWADSTPSAPLGVDMSQFRLWVGQPIESSIRTS